ncbi:hypothetical protein Ancab_006308 [Ancistrocladus abbreviatus]
MAIGELFLGAVLQVLFDRLTAPQMITWIGQRRYVDVALLSKFKVTLLTVEVLLSDAEERQITSRAVRQWLDDLKDAFYDAEDVLDEIATDALRQSVEPEPGSLSFRNKVWNLIPTSHNSFEKTMAIKVNEVIKRLDNMVSQGGLLGLGLKDVGHTSQVLKRLPTTCLVEEFGIHGRDVEREKIIELLLSEEMNGMKIDVVAIVGIGGLGKTTLAKLVYNDSRLKDFDFKTWICVSDDFDVFRVTKTILQSVNPESFGNVDDLNALQVDLHESLMGKKFLIVLDDVWNESKEQWDLLRSPFNGGARGSKIIVTTRNDGVASIMCTVPIFRLKLLSDDDGWLLFSHHAFVHGNPNAHPHLVEIGKKIARKCKGLPLAIKTIGTLLKSKLEIEEWESILNNGIWCLPEEKNEILPALKLSYHYLPAHLKRCFAYCSIFPKGHTFVKENLVRAWMAEDFVEQPKGNAKRREDVGDEYFLELLSRSFFQPASDDGGGECYVMHDLFHDLALVVSGDFCAQLEKSKPSEISKRVRHMSCTAFEDDNFNKYEFLSEAKRLRTFLRILPRLWYYGSFYLNTKVPSDLLPQLGCLRVLSLSGYQNCVLPSTIGNLKHLRYLDVSYTRIKELPASICSLYNLQTLLLSNCGFLQSLPTNMSQLISLRYLDITGTNLKEMPMQMSKLKNLQTLTEFVVSRHGGSSIGELGEFPHLRGKLVLRGLQNVAFEDALEADLRGKTYLHELGLEFGTMIDDSKKERNVLDVLQPHTNVKRLIIRNYGGTCFPDWLGDHSFSNIVFLCLSNCFYCYSMPPLGQLPSLKYLEIKGMINMQIIGAEFYGNSSFSNPFPSLEKLTLEGMKELKQWMPLEVEGVLFPCLQELSLQDCPKLTGCLPAHLPSLRKLWISRCQRLIVSLPLLPSILELVLEKCVKVALRDVVQLTSLTTLTVRSLPMLRGMPTELTKLSFLKELTIGECPVLQSLSGMGLPPMLEKFFIFGYRPPLKLPYLTLSVERMQNFTALQRLEITVNALVSFPLGAFPRLRILQFSCFGDLEHLYIPQGVNHDGLVHLQHLKIWFCRKLESLVGGELPTPNLISLEIMGCPNLRSLPSRMDIHLTSLRQLKLVGCPGIEPIRSRSFPSNLTSLEIDHFKSLASCWNTRCFNSFHHLQVLSVAGHGVESFAEKGSLPTTLIELSIKDFRNLKFLNGKGLQSLTSLSELKISLCPQLHSLPEEGLPPSISYLKIDGCPLLEDRCQRDKGLDWPKIAHMGCICIRNQVI